MTQTNNNFLGNIRTALGRINSLPTSNSNQRVAELIDFVCYLEDHLETELAHKTRGLRMFLMMLKDEIQEFKKQVTHRNAYLDQELVAVFVKHASMVSSIIDTLVTH